MSDKEARRARLEHKQRLMLLEETIRLLERQIQLCEEKRRLEVIFRDVLDEAVKKRAELLSNVSDK